MQYRQFTDLVLELDFIPDEQTADSAVKAVLGILASAMEESEARELTESLPEPLTYDRLHGRQVRPIRVNTEELFLEIANQFNLDKEQAVRLVERVFDATKQALPEDKAEHLAAQLPPDLGALLEAV